MTFSPPDAPRVDAALADLLFQTSGVGVGVIDASLRYVRVNEALAQMNGRPAADHPGRHISEVLPADAVALLEPLLERVLQGEPAVDLAISTPVAGAVRNFLVSYWPIRDEGGHGRGIVALVVERTEALRDAMQAEFLAREVAQSALRRAQALQQVSTALAGAVSAEEVARVVVSHGRAAIGASAGSIARLDAATGQFHIVASEGYGEGLARSFEHFPVTPGRPLSDAVLSGTPIYISSVKDGAARYPFVREALRDTRFEAYVGLPVFERGVPAAGLSFSFEEPHAFDAEERAFFETLAAQAGQALERGELIDAERRARAEAEAANRAKAEFLATMSHELRTPLNAISGHIQLVELGLHGPLTDAQRDALQRVQRAQRHLLGLINDLLNFARLESGRLEYDIAPVELRDIVADVLPLVEPLTRDKGLALETSSSDAEERLVVLADRDKLRQVLLNLVSNAVKFTPSGGRVVIAAEADGIGRARLRVSDTGIGIPADKFGMIFEPFVQLGRQYTENAGGTGLGLAISRDLTRAMGGDIVVDSRPGEGTTFTVSMPRAS